MTDTIGRRLTDDVVRENDGWVPAALKPDDNDAMKAAKKTIYGSYILLKRVWDFVRFEYLSLTKG